MDISKIRDKKVKENILNTMFDLLDQDIKSGYFKYYDFSKQQYYLVKYTVDININIDA